MNLKQAQSLGERRLRALARKAWASPVLRCLAPHGPWQIELRVVGASVMAQLNATYRKKNYATDVLSFPAPAVFRRAGRLGELVVCLPVLKRQAGEQGHSEARELDVLLAHGLLHLLGFDHERGASQAREQKRWEARLLGRDGLIGRQNP